MVEDLFPTIEGFSVFGEALIQFSLSPETKETLEKHFLEALKNYNEDTKNPENLIWLGRRTAYLGRFREAISIFTKGIKQFPNDPRMYRHRGHRFLTLRQFDLAFEDFLKASKLIDGKKDQIEPDGVPNARGIPVSTLHSNIWYHLGLVAYLKDDLMTAKDAYENCLRVSKIDDNYVSTGHWLYMTLRLLNQREDAEKLLVRLSDELDIIENQFYHNLMRMYKGELQPKMLLEQARKNGSMELATVGYGVANWYFYNGDKITAKNILKEIHSTDGWASFGYIAAEVLLKKMKHKRRI